MFFPPPNGQEVLEESFLQQTRALPAPGCSSGVDLLGCSPRPCPVLWRSLREARGRRPRAMALTQPPARGDVESSRMGPRRGGVPMVTDSQGRGGCFVLSLLFFCSRAPSQRAQGAMAQPLGGESAEDKSGLVSPPGAVPLCPGGGSRPSLSPHPLTMGLSLCPSPPKHVPTAAHQAVVAPLTSPTGGDARGGALCKEQPSPGQSRTGALL